MLPTPTAQTYGGEADDGASVESDIIMNAANRRDSHSGAMPGAGASQMGDVIRRLEERSLAQQRGLLWTGDAGSQDDIEEADAEDDSGGGEDDDGDSDAHSSFIDDTDLVEMAARNQRLARSSLLQGDWFVIAANDSLQHEVDHQPTPPPAARAPAGPTMDKRLAKREKARRKFIQEHADEAVEWKANMTPSVSTALKALEAAASSRAPCPFTANWSARSAGITSAPEWPQDLEALLSDLDEAVCGTEETPLGGQTKRVHRPAGYTAVLLSHAVPFSEQEIKRNLKRLQAIRLVKATWEALQRSLAPLAGAASVSAPEQAAVGLRAHLCLGNYRKALRKHRAALRPKERTQCSEVYSVLSDTQLKRSGVPQAELLGLAPLASQVQEAARRALAVSVPAVPEGADTEDFVFNPRTPKFWQEGCVQHKALQRQLLALLRSKVPQAAASEEALDALKTNAAVMAQANQLDAMDAVPKGAAATPTASAAATAGAAAAPKPLPLQVQSSTTPAAAMAPFRVAAATPPQLAAMPVPAPAPAAAASSSSAPKKAAAAPAYGPSLVYGHFAQKGAPNSMLVIPGTHGEVFYVPSVPDLTRALLDKPAHDGVDVSLTAAQHEQLSVAQQNSMRTWANFQQPPPMSVEELHECIQKASKPGAANTGGVSASSQ